MFGAKLAIAAFAALFGVAVSEIQEAQSADGFSKLAALNGASAVGQAAHFDDMTTFGQVATTRDALKLANELNHFVKHGQVFHMKLKNIMRQASVLCGISEQKKNNSIESFTEYINGLIGTNGTTMKNLKKELAATKPEERKTLRYLLAKYILKPQKTKVPAILALTQSVFELNMSFKKQLSHSYKSLNTLSKYYELLQEKENSVQKITNDNLSDQATSTARYISEQVQNLVTGMEETIKKMGDFANFAKIADSMVRGDMEIRRYINADTCTDAQMTILNPIPLIPHFGIGSSLFNAGKSSANTRIITAENESLEKQFAQSIKSIFPNDFLSVKTNYNEKKNLSKLPVILPSLFQNVPEIAQLYSISVEDDQDMIDLYIRAANNILPSIRIAPHKGESDISVRPVENSLCLSFPNLPIEGEQVDIVLSKIKKHKLFNRLVKGFCVKGRVCKAKKNGALADLFKDLPKVAAELGGSIADIPLPGVDGTIQGVFVGKAQKEEDESTSTYSHESEDTNLPDYTFHDVEGYKVLPVQLHFKYEQGVESICNEDEEFVCGIGF